MEGVGFTDARNKIVNEDPQAPPPGVTYFFWFRSIFNELAIDKRGPNRYLFVKFSLCLSQTLIYQLPDMILPSVVNTISTFTTPTQVDTAFEGFAQEVGKLYGWSYIENMTIEDL